jgi:HlyD family secretion protein
MIFRLVRFLLLLACGASAIGCARARAPAEAARREGAPAPAPAAGASELAARRAPFERRLLISGEIDAVSAADLKVPRVSAGRSVIRWLEVDGTAVKAGQKVAELDNANFVTQVKERSLAASQAEIDLKRQEWQNGLDGTDRLLQVERMRAIVRRAEVDADVPEGILPKRDFLEKQLALRKAQADLERAQEAHRTQQRTAALDLQMKRVALERIQREVQAAQEMIDALTMTAPADGTIIIGDHFEGRKLQVGDDVQVGHTLVRMPDLKQIRIKGWLSDVDDGKIAVEMPAEIVLDAFPDRSMTGKVLEIAPMAREASERSLRRVFQVSLALDLPGDAREASDLRPGLSARVEVIAQRLPASVLVPRVALATDAPGGPAVRLASGEARAVKLGPCNSADCIIESGIDPGTRLERWLP